jgi:hypothetical protein
MATSKVEQPETASGYQFRYRLGNATVRCLVRDASVRQWTHVQALGDLVPSRRTRAGVCTASDKLAGAYRDLSRSIEADEDSRPPVREAVVALVASEAEYSKIAARVLSLATAGDRSAAVVEVTVGRAVSTAA